MKTISFFVSLIGPIGQKFFAHFLATLLFRVLRIRRKLTLQNIDRAFGDTMSEKEKTKIGYDSVYNFTLSLVEFLAARKGEISDHVKIEGREHLDQAFEQGKGVYVLCCHLGNWEAMGSVMNREFHPTYVLVKKVGSESMNRFVTELRDKNDFKMVKRKGKGSATRVIISVLKKNECIGFVMDQARPSEARYPFFGHPAKTNTGFAAIWRRNQAPIIPAYIERTSVGHHIFHIGEEIILQPTDSAENDIKEFTGRFNLELEKMIRKKPDQYFWMHNRWKA
jgi:KDO2-lipid IV(A) lauroyltransferase